MKHGKKYRAVSDKLPKAPVTLEEAVKLLPETSITKFDASCEIHFNLNIDPRHADQNIRIPVGLPNGTGKEVRVVAFCEDDKVSAAKSAGAVEAGLEKLVEKITEGWTEFDVAVAEPAAMKAIGKIAKILGQKGLMPNPKAGTVGPDVAKMVQEIKKGKVEIRNDKAGNIHVLFGKVSFGEAKLLENVKVIVAAVMDAKPAGVKGGYVKSAHLTTAMGPSIKIENSSL